MAWPFQTTEWEAYMLRSFMGSARQSKSTVTANTLSQSEQSAAYQRQQLQSIVSNRHAEGNQARPRFVQSNHHNASVSLDHRQQTHSQMTHAHFPMHTDQHHCDSGSTNMPTNRLQQLQTCQQNLYPVDSSYCIPRAPNSHISRVDYDPKYCMVGHSPPFRDSLQLAYQADFQQPNYEDLAFRRNAMSEPLGSSTPTSARLYASFHSPSPRNSRMNMINNQLYAHEMSRGNSSQSIHSLSPLQPQHQTGLSSGSQYGDVYPSAALLVQSQPSAVKSAMRWIQESNGQTMWQRMQDNQRKQTHEVSMEDVQPPPKRQQIATAHHDSGQLFTDQATLKHPAHGQGSPTTRAQLNRLENGLNSNLVETVNRASHTEISALMNRTCLQVDSDRKFKVVHATAQTQQTPIPSLIITVDDDQHTVDAVQSASPNSKFVPQLLSEPRVLHQHDKAPAQLKFPPCIELDPPENHASNHDDLPVTMSSSQKQTEVPRDILQDSPKSIAPQVMLVPHLATPQQCSQKNNRSTGQDIVPQELQAPTGTVPKVRPKAPKRSRKKPNPPKPKPVTTYKPVEDVTQLGVLKLQSAYRTCVSSGGAKRDAGPRKGNPPTLLQGTHRSSRHFKCTCAYPNPTCFAPEDPLGCPKQTEAEQRMEEANRGRDRCLEVRYIGSRSQDRGKAT